MIGSRSAAQKITLTNFGNSAVHIKKIKIAGRDMRDFAQHANCPATLPAGAHCTIRVTFQPTALGPRAARVQVFDDAPGSPQEVPLRGLGATSGPNATLSTHHLDFPLQLVGTTSPPQPVTLSNFGTETLDITSIVASGDFSKSDNCNSSLPPGAHCTIDVTFTPRQGGNRRGMVLVTDNAPDSPQRVRLTGLGTVVLLNPPSLNFGEVIVGEQSSPQNTTLTNVGKARLHISNIAITGTDEGDFSQKNSCPDPRYLGGGKSCTITVTFKPTQLGQRSADVSISDDGGGSPQQVTLSGFGVERCSGACGFVCAFRHCRCSFNRCVPPDPGVVDLLWPKEKGRELQCAEKPVALFGCTQVSVDDAGLGSKDEQGFVRPSD